MRIREDDIGWPRRPWDVVDADVALAGHVPAHAAVTGVRPRWSELARAMPLAGVEGLSLANARLTAAELGLLARRDDAAGIRALHLGGNALDRDGLRALVGTPLFATLVELEVDAMPLGPDALAVIARAVPTLERLAIAQVGLDVSSIAAPLPRLRWLALARNPLRAVGLDRVLHDLQAPLDVVDLSTTMLEAAPTHGLDRVRAASLSRNALAGEATAQLLASCRERLAWLDAGWTHTGDGLLAALVGAPALRTLFVENAQITDTGARALAAGRLDALVTLGLANNEIGEAGARAFATWQGAPELVECDLRGNAVPPDRARELHRSSPRVRFDGV